MYIKVDYNNCLTNLSCSIRKYFGLEVRHKTIKLVDELLNEKQPKNVVVILFDGMGSLIIDEILKNNDFFIKNRIGNITSVFPSTTTAATTSFLTGLNPNEHGWLGWNMYIKPLDKTMTLFTGEEKVSKLKCDEFKEIKRNLYSYNIVDEINDNGIYKAIKLLPFGDNKYENLDQMLNIIENETNKDGKKFIYAYDDEPDGTMHDFGFNSTEVKKLIIERNNKVEKLIEKLSDTMVFVIADHGQINVDMIHLENDYPELYNMLERTTSIECRAVSFKVKDGYKNEFKNTFNKYLGNDFNLLTKEQVLENHIFGEGNNNIYFEDAIGDFIAIASESNKAILTKGDSDLISMHGGNSNREIYVPLIACYKD